MNQPSVLPVTNTANQHFLAPLLKETVKPSPVITPAKANTASFDPDFIDDIYRQHQLIQEIAEASTLTAKNLALTATVNSETTLLINQDRPQPYSLGESIDALDAQHHLFENFIANNTV